MQTDGSNNNEQDLPNMLTMGYISGTFGIRGEVKVFLYNPQTDLFRSSRPITLLFNDGQQVETSLKTRPGAGKKILGDLPELNTPEAASKYIGAKICIPTGDLPKLKEGEWYHFELLGLPVHTQSHVYLGDIVEIVTGQVDIWIVENKSGEAYYIPNEQTHICSVNISNDKDSNELPYGVVVVDFDEDDE
ncbi:MAG: 16S rRNA processing protein RimM [Proteobacteria bacterium]|nr:16S rRNA processing protein RimM [Pseudomonadota bacterium]